MYQKVSAVSRRVVEKLRNRPVAPKEPALPPARRGAYIGLDDAFEMLRCRHYPDQPLFEVPLQNTDGVDAPPPAPRSNQTTLPGAVQLHAAPESRISGHWASPRGRLLEIKARVETGGRWFGLHVPLPAVDFSESHWLVLTLRSSAATATLVKPCLRSGLETGFRDDFFPRAILAQSQETDHLDMLALDRLTALPGNLPATAPWRELVLFLPPATDMHLMLNSLRLAAL